MIAGEAPAAEQPDPRQQGLKPRSLPGEMVETSRPSSLIQDNKD